jgi:serine/threonine-protein kinase
VNTGEVIDDRYRVLSRLGSGGMADVYLAEDQQLGRKVAVKLLHSRFAEDPGFVERFRREAQAAAGLQHPNVVSVYDRGAYDDTYYIAMEYLPGRSLKQLIRQEAPLEPVRAIDLAIQILRAARFAHRRGVIHRDLKPHNVIVDDTGHAKVTDFGIARAGASDMTETGSIMGTSQYLSPEQAQGLAVGATSDLYSVGIVLYEMLTGRVPFDADSPVTIALKHVSEAPVPPSHYNPDVPPELEQVVLWALNKNPEDRPADADQFITVLERVKEAIVSRERGERTASMAALGAIPPTVGAAVGAGAAVAPVVAADALPTDGGGWVPVGTTPPTQPPEPGDRRRSPWPWVLALVVLLLIGGGVAAYLLTRPVKDIVPHVVGEPIDNAQARVQAAGFTVNVQSRPDPSKAGTVIFQFPDAGVKLDAGSTVTLTESTGPGSVSVPPVAGRTEAAAERALRRAGLRVAQIQKQNSTSVATGHAIATDPRAGDSVGAGSDVTLIVSSGRALVRVPDVTGETEQNARTNLTAAGFTVTSSAQASATVTKGDVVSQTPAGATKAPAGFAVALVVSSGPGDVNVPSVTGDTATHAQSVLRSAGFTVSRRTKTVSDPAQNAVVVAQSPANGTAPKGSAVTITVGRYTAPKTPTTPTTTTPTTSIPGSTTTTP